MVLHVHGFGFTFYGCVISNPNFSGFITLYGIFGLIPTHIDKGMKNMDNGFGADEEASNLGFGSRGYNKLDYLGESENRAIYDRDRGVF